jgi:hypothetical protein
VARRRSRSCRLDTNAEMDGSIFSWRKSHPLDGMATGRLRFEAAFEVGN